MHGRAINNLKGICQPSTVREWRPMHRLDLRRLSEKKPMALEF